MKNRKIGYTYGSVSGRYAFRKEKTVAFESTLERDLLTLLEFNDSVLDVVEQPVTLEYINHNGRLVPYTPDFLVYFKTSPAKGMLNPYPRPMLIEVKPSEKLQKHFNEFRPRFKVATKYAMENGYIFKIYDEKRIRGQELKNINFIARHKNLQYNPDEEERILNHLKAVGHTTIEHLLTHLYVTDVQRGIGLGQTWHLLASKKISCDIRLPLNQHTVIWLNNDESYEEGVLNAY
jgi:hypothetical protein